MIQKIIEQTQLGEISCVVSIKDSGKDIIFRELEKLLPQEFGQTNDILSYQLFTDEDILKFLKSQEIIIKPRIVLINLHLDKDIPEFFKNLNRLRYQFSTDFIPIILTHHLEVKTALSSTNKIVARGLFYLQQVDNDDAEILIKDFEERFKFILNQEQKAQIIKISAGHLGLLKTLYILSTKTPEILNNLENLLNNEQILYRLKEMSLALSNEDIANLYSGKLNHFESLVFNNFGYLKNAEVFSELLKKYFLIEHLLPASRIEKQLTNQELVLYTILKENEGEVVSREEIVSIIWKDKSEVYTEWALDKLISRLRDKMLDLNSGFVLDTKKGRGFILKQKSQK